MTDKFTIKKLKTWNSFKAYVDRFSPNWRFRGQSSDTWEIKSSLERTEFFKLSNEIEIDFLIEFQRGARNFLTELEIPTNLVEWLALMQHHGAPTRLVDFTKSPYIAAFFAFENTLSSKNVAIWALNIDIVKERVEAYLDLSNNPEIEERRKHLSDENFEKTRRHFEEKDFEELFFTNNKSCIFPIEPFRMNRRYSLQQSVFISPANSFEPFMEQLNFLEGNIKKSLVKIVLPANLRDEVNRDLLKMNITRASIFPGLDGYSSALKMKYNLKASNIEYLLKLMKDKKLDIHF